MTTLHMFHFATVKTASGDVLDCDYLESYLANGFHQANLHYLNDHFPVLACHPANDGFMNMNAVMLHDVIKLHGSAFVD